MNVCTKFLGSSSNVCRDISLKNTSFNFMVVQEEISPKSLGSSGSHEYVQNLEPINHVDVDIVPSISEKFDLLVALDETSKDHKSH